MKKVAKYIDSKFNAAAFEKHAIVSFMICFVLFELNMLTAISQIWYLMYVYLCAILLGLHLLLIIAKRLWIKISKKH